MLTEEEEKFLLFWEKDREKKTSLLRDFSVGLPLGLLICVGVLLNYVSGWYTRATMEANGGSTPLVLIVAFIAITVFCSYFYKRFKREMNEQRYLELLHKKNLQNPPAPVQQDAAINSQVTN